MTKDINHTVRLYYHRFKRGWRDDISPHFSEGFVALSDFVNAIMRGVLSLLALLFLTLADICNRWKSKCYRKEPAILKTIPVLEFKSKTVDNNQTFFN